MSGWLQIRKENTLVANTHLTGSRVVIGRSPDCDVVLASDSVSRQHAELVAHGDAWSVRDLGCLLYTSPSPRDRTRSRMPSSA